jgi:hypothetical protein
LVEIFNPSRVIKSMSLKYLLADVICRTFLKSCGKWQSKKDSPKMFVVGFSIPIHHSLEDGYRHVDIGLYAEFNYVNVYVRERWDVIALEDLEDDDDGGPKPGKDYVKGDSGWKLLGSHDSGWRGMVEEFLGQYRVGTFDSNGADIYELVDPSGLPDRE